MLAVYTNESKVSSDCHARPALDVRAQILLMALNALLRATRAVAASYQTAIWRASATRLSSLKQLLEGHYELQSGLADVIEDRISSLGGTPQGISSNFIYETQFRVALVGKVPLGLLEGLVDAHHWILRTACPSLRIFGEAAHWVRDFAVGRVVLTNDLQRAALLDELRSRSVAYRFAPDCNSWEM